jgi:hypothetical protein
MEHLEFPERGALDLPVDRLDVLLAPDRSVSLPPNDLITAADIALAVIDARR